ncbi:uncharacterized protein ARMOST_11207 [Armillaria ostoyae]|uniref:Uncharacterized protein n=1 Tax=Armillaria ostoyae TaxID=47428 RepID=A0A284RGG8_ARMOS|nr:uncharacterized protein ARMOST_11207 [Armillaria ostoyae]
MTYTSIAGSTTAPYTQQEVHRREEDGRKGDIRKATVFAIYKLAQAPRNFVRCLPSLDDLKERKQDSPLLGTSFDFDGLGVEIIRPARQLNSNCSDIEEFVHDDG